MDWLPAQFLSDTSWIDRIAAVVAWAVFHRRNQLGVGPPPGSS